MNLAKDRNHVTALFEQCRLAWVHGKVFTTLYSIFAYTDRREDAFHNPLQIIEIHHRIVRIPRDWIAPPRDESRDHELLVGKFRDGQCLREEYGRDIEEPQIHVLACDIARRILKHARE